MRIVSDSRFIKITEDPEDIISIASRYHRYIDYDHFDNIYGDGFDNHNLIDHDHRIIQTWADVVEYSLLFLNGKIPRTVFHDGVYASETLYILDQLKLIHKYGLITLDSQPGCVIQNEDTCLIQLPYLNLIGPISELQKIINQITDPYIVIYQFGIEPIKNVTSDLTTKLEHLKLDQPYGSVYLSVDDSLNRIFLEYILSNRFFENITESLMLVRIQH